MRAISTMKRWLRVAAALGAVSSAIPAAAAEFDGRWSVLVITEKGDCDQGYRYEVSVGQGKVSYAGSEAGVAMTGSISPAGQVNIKVRRTIGSKGDDEAAGTGKLSANAGAGKWRTSGPDGDCSGRWEAERR